MYKSCNVSAGTPIENFNTVNGSIKINNHGHNLFMCGFPGHCQKSQKVDINVIRASATKSPSPSPSTIDDDDDDDFCSCPNKAVPSMASLNLIGPVMLSYDLKFVSLKVVQSSYHFIDKKTNYRSSLIPQTTLYCPGILHKKT
ncbi:uclacyanin 1-like [Prosopis cineraria]|uniref:uclacyanin 1-like n=1 Tax=Prosopis cineraria TaxID=364024 RepID=UPI00240EFCB7|nr:uclacyanin 1-like [Prosopis cineraria]